ncbi:MULTISPECIES: SDR family NAD(P)-dependent oxidoreductase [unclassified Kribbella]|uniref:SDR family NAD(P)-dependent oxidoreductase n=1 Tax=unclassified Kribbella TaxID=2644121 RepID=UPI00301A863A
MADSFRLHGRVALVTGGNGGIGLAVARGLRRAGASVAVTGRDSAKNARARNELGSDALVLDVDVSDEDEVADAVDQVASVLGGLTVLVNNAGTFRGGALTDLSLSAWRAVIDSHLTGAFLCAKHAARHMQAAGGGKIINVGSMYSYFGPPDFADYAAATTGLLGLTRALAVELAPQHIQVNAILPGWFETDLTRGLRGSRLGEQIRRKTPAGRWGELDDLVGPVVFLASPAADFVTGAALPVDGGYLVADRLRPNDD